MLNPSAEPRRLGTDRRDEAMCADGGAASVEVQKLDLGGLSDRRDLSQLHI